MSWGRVRFHRLAVFPVWMCCLELASPSQQEDEGLTNAGIVNQDVNSSPEELCCLLNFLPYAIYALVGAERRVKG
jgi:hypothetical protein